MRSTFFRAWVRIHLLPSIYNFGYCLHRSVLQLQRRPQRKKYTCGRRGIGMSCFVRFATRTQFITLDLLRS
jgi:hypothetical protein